MKVGVVLFPGSNCAQDLILYFQKRGHQAFYIWYQEQDISKYTFDLLALPGGFSFGDRFYQKATGDYVIQPGKMALDSPVCKLILETHRQRIPIVGICNGFQILTQLNLLPGELKRNKNLKFTCQNVKCRLESKIVPRLTGRNMKIDVANEYGRYYIGKKELKELEKNDQILMTYQDDYAELNGSVGNIAGVCDKEKLIFGMMPHFERTLDSNLPIFNVIESVISKKSFQQSIENLMFSEHISYKSTRKYLKRLYIEGEGVVVGPGENAGIVDLGDGYCLAIRVESHNHPTFIDPFNGASTGVGGILRDIFTMGARPIGILDFLRFGTNDHSKELLKETVRGISYYGNCFGVANVGGDCFTSKMYDTNPLVNVACLGIVKKKDIVYGRATTEGSLMIYVGSKTGAEGVNGAAMASGSFSSDVDTSTLKDNIQFGDPFLEKLLLEGCLEIVENGLLEGMQDMGAGGVLCSSLEVVQRGQAVTGKNLGCWLNVDKIPCKYQMDDCDKLISESQERMLLVVKMENKDKVFSIFEKWDLEYAVVGGVDGSGYYKILKSNNSVLYKKKVDSFSNPSQDWKEVKQCLSDNDLKFHNDEMLWNTYDSTIGCRTVVNNRIRCDNLPNTNFSILDIHENGKQIILTWGSDFDECYSPIMERKFKPLGLVNCLNYGHPKDSIGEMKKFLEKLTKKCKENKVPVLGGNVSLYNATDDVSINPTPILVMVGVSS